MSQDFLNDIQKFINTPKQQTEKEVKVNTSNTQTPQAAPAQGSCTDLINEAISTLNEALTECVCPPPLTCGCNARIVSCLAETNITLINQVQVGSATIQAKICEDCTPENSTVLFNFIRDETASFVTFTSLTVDTICCTPSSIISISGTGALSIDDFIIPNLTFTFSFGNIAGDQCFFSLNVDTFLIAGDTVSCLDANISITPCADSGQSNEPTIIKNKTVSTHSSVESTSEISDIKEASPCLPCAKKTISEDSPISTQQTCVGTIPVTPCPPTNGIVGKAINQNVPIAYGTSTSPNTTGIVDLATCVNCDCTGDLRITIFSSGSTPAIFTASAITFVSVGNDQAQINATGNITIGRNPPFQNITANLIYFLPGSGCQGGNDQCCYFLQLLSGPPGFFKQILLIQTSITPISTTCPTIVSCTSSTEE